MNTTRKSLITGGAGFIGSHLSEALLKRGHEIYCIDNLSTGNKRNISHLLTCPRFHFIAHDIVSPYPPTIANMPARQAGQQLTIDYIYHLASPASPPAYRRLAIDTLLVNSVGTYHTLELAKQKKSRILLASTSEVYGDPQKHPQTEGYFGNVNPVGLRACYDESKRFAEALTMEYFRKFHLSIRIARIFNTYGPRMEKDDGRVVSNFVTQATNGNPLTIYGSGNQTRSFCYISDMVNGLISFMEADAIDGEVINLGSTQELSINHIAELVLKISGSKSKISFGQKRLGDDPQRRKPDISKALKLLRWTPKISLQEGLEKTISYFRSL